MLAEVQDSRSRYTAGTCSDAFQAADAWKGRAGVQDPRLARDGEETPHLRAKVGGFRRERCCKTLDVTDRLGNIP